MREVGEPRFDSIVLGEVVIKRLNASDTVEAKFAFVNKTTSQTYGWTTIAQPQMLSKRTRELLSELSDSLEADAAAAFFKTNQPLEEKEGLHEPTGLAESEDDSQQL